MKLRALRFYTSCPKFTLLIFAPLLAAPLIAQPVVLEDWTCPTFTAAVTGNPTIFTCSSPHGYPPGTLLVIEGGTGTWSGINVTGSSWPVTVIDSTRISIPFNSTGMTFAGQNLAVQRADLDYGSSMFIVNLAEQWSLTQQPQEGYLRVTVPGCPDLNDDIGCGRGFSSPENAKYPGLNQTIKTYSVAGGIATITFTAAFPNDPPPGTNRQIGYHSLVWVRRMSNTALNQSYVVQSITPDHTQITVRAPAGVADGTYTGSTPAVYIGWPVGPYVFVRARTKSGYIYPQGTIQNYLKSGTFSSALNRVRFWMRFGKNVNLTTIGTTVNNLDNGTYWLSSADNSTNKLTHSYHKSNIGNSYTGVWQKVEFNMDFTHVEGASGNLNWGNDSTYTGFPYYPAWAGTPIHYIDALGSWYINIASSLPGIDYSGETFDVGPVELDTATGEPEELVTSRSIQAVTSRFATGDAGYELNWSGPKNVPVSYEVRYSTAGSLKTAGFSTGLCKNGTTACSSADSVVNPNSAYVGVSYNSVSMSQQPNIWFGIRPTAGILSASGQGQSPIWITTGVDLTMSPGDHVTVAGVGGNTAANQVNVPIQSTQPRQIWFRYAPQPVFPWITPGTLNNIVASGGTCTVSLNVPHGIVPGWTIQVYGSTNASLGQNPVNYRVTSVPTPQSMTFLCPAVPNGTYDTSESNSTPLNVMAYPGIAIPGTGNGNWTGNGKVVSTEDNKNFAEISLGATPSAAPEVTGPLSACDVNGDGAVNVIDVQLEINASEGLIPCTVDPAQDGTCNVVDVQRVINAALTGVCQVGP